MNEATVVQTGAVIYLEIYSIRLLSYDEFAKCVDFMPLNIVMNQHLWWLGTQSPDFKDDFLYAQCIKNNKVIVPGRVDDRYYVRPVAEINLDKFNISCGNEILFKQGLWKVISTNPGLMLYENNIGRCQFNESIDDSFVGDYEYSHIKKFVDRWVREKKIEVKIDLDGLLNKMSFRDVNRLNKQQEIDNKDIIR